MNKVIVNKKEFEKFREMFEYVCSDIAKGKKHVSIAHGGGVDSTAVLCGFIKSGIVPFSLHVRSNNDSSWEFKFGDCMVEYLSKLTRTPLIVIPHEVLHSKIGFYNTMPIYGLKDVVTGEGMDRCYGQWDANRQVTFGMDFRANHPLVDMLLNTVPTRFRNYRAIKYEDSIKHGIIGEEREELITISKTFGLDLTMVSKHPTFEKFFLEYEENIRDIFFPKALTFEYVRQFFGKSFNSIAREVYKLNRPKFEPFFLRMLGHTKEEKSR